MSKLKWTTEIEKEAFEKFCSEIAYHAREEVHNRVGVMCDEILEKLTTYKNDYAIDSSALDMLLHNITTKLQETKTWL